MQHYSVLNPHQTQVDSLKLVAYAFPLPETIMHFKVVNHVTSREALDRQAGSSHAGTHWHGCKPESRAEARETPRMPALGAPLQLVVNPEGFKAHPYLKETCVISV